MAMADQAELAVRLSLDDRFSGPMGRAAGSLGKFEGSMKRTGRGVGQLAGGLARVAAVGFAATTAGLVGVARAAIDFEEAFAGVVKTVDEDDLARAGLTFDDLARSFRDMATEMPIAATELARIGETAGALGIAANDIDDFTKTVALLSVTTNLSADEAAESLGKVGTVLGLTGEQYEDFADVLVNLGNQGASTESEIIEITKRFAAAGRQAGLATPEILALASATASLGIEPEAAGGALSRIFANMASDIALATDAGQAFAKITGDSIETLGDRIDSGDALGILMETLGALQDMSRTEAASVLQALGITNVRDRDAILKMSQNLEFVNDQLDIATESTGALGAEAQKRFDTIASKLTVLKNGFIEAAITIGNGFLPALGRAAEKLTEFLKQDSNRAALTELGRDIGEFIDSIDWEDVLSGARSLVGVLTTAGSIAATVVGALSKLPKEVLAFGTVALGANAISGGLIAKGLGNIGGGLLGGIGGGLVRGVGSQLPGVGGAFVQRVFVVNMPMGGMGGGGGPLGAGKGLLGGIGTLAMGSLAGALTVGVGTLAAGIVASLGIKAASGQSEAEWQNTVANTYSRMGGGGPVSVEGPVLEGIRTSGAKTVRALEADRAVAERSLRAEIMAVDAERTSRQATTSGLAEVARRTTESGAKIARVGDAIRNMRPPQVSVTVPVTVRTNVSVSESRNASNTYSFFRPPSGVQIR